ncbi:MAG TPA: ABC transporter substrate-binding protein [Acidimicrobiales bacterium]|nr:ABC transporter substrate-binding protein [Acidimicrobiales bacterium]
MHRPLLRVVAATTAITLLAAACGAEDEDDAGGGGLDGTEETTTTEAAAVGDLDRIPEDTTGVTETSVRIGIHAPLMLGGLDLDSILGLGKLSRAYWDMVNDAGGINGRTVEVELINDGYTVDTALQACRDMIQKDVLFISGTGGADQIVACAQLALGEQMPYLSLGVSEAGLVDQDGYRALTATYEQSSRLLAHYIAGELDGAGKKLAMIRFNSPNADGAHQAFVDELGAAGLDPLVVDDAVDKQGNANELTSECLKLKQAAADIVYIIAAPTVSTMLARSCASQAYTPQYVTVPNTLACAVEPPLGAQELDGCIALSGARSPDDTDNELTQQAHSTWEAAYPGEKFPNDGETFWGYFDVLREALDQAGDDLNRRSFLTALSALDYDNGLFNPIRFEGTKVNQGGVVVLRANFAIEGFDTIVPEWTTKF